MTTNPFPCRVFPHGIADGPANMACDEALLELVAAEPDAAAFRTYGWTEPTLSLGYFQSIAEVEGNSRWRDVAVVRRPTGGGAILHDLEVTYALAIPRDHPLSRGSGELYQAVHAILAELLGESGVDARRRGGGADASMSRPFLCFSDRDPEDVVVGRDKVVGSAQRRRSGAILQHGALLLARSPLTPELPGASDLSAVSGDVTRWSDLIGERLPRALGMLARPEPWSDSLVARSAGLADSVYRSAGWTRRR